MDRGSKVIELHKNRSEEAAAGAPALQEELAGQLEELWLGGDEVPASGRWRRPLALSLCLGGALLWLALLGVERWLALAGRTPLIGDFVSFIVTAAPPLALFGVIWLVLMRSSRAEADRFEKTRAAMEAEGKRLQVLLSFVSSRIEESRSSLSEQGDSLMSLGEEAASRLQGSAQAIAREIEAINGFAHTLQGSAAATRGDLAVLLSHLPKAQVQMRTIATALEQAGSTAQGSAKALSGEVVALGLKSQEAKALAHDAAAQLSGQVETLNTQVAALQSQLEQGHGALANAGSEASEALAARIMAVSAETARIGEMLADHDVRGAAIVERLGEGVGTVDARFAELETQAAGRAARLGDALAALRNHADDLRAALDSGGEAATGLTEKTESLLTALDAAAREIDETIPTAYARLEEQAGRALESARSVEPLVASLAGQSEALADRVGQTDQVIARQRAALEELTESAAERLEACRAQADAMLVALGSANDEAGDLARIAGGELLDVLARTREVAQQAVEQSRKALDALVPDAAGRMGEASRAALTDTLSVEVDSHLAEMGSAIARAVGSARETVEQLERQVQSIGRTSAALEARIEATQDESDKRDHAHFARRVALLIESLNSTAIDVTKILSNDVTDMAWAAYMRGDRGVFSRRAVKLLDNAEAREIARHYQDDPEFREQVNRYIHDYEAMLRNVMATRDGTPLSVALLSSDTGKLYVALAQAIERLRV